MNDHSASRNADVLREEAPHLLASDNAVREHTHNIILYPGQSVRLVLTDINGATYEFTAEAEGGITLSEGATGASASPTAAGQSSCWSTCIRSIPTRSSTRSASTHKGG